MSFDALMRAMPHSRDSSDLVVQTAISTSVAITYQPAEPCILRVSVASCSVYGECLITGTNANDTSIEEYTAFIKADKRIGQKIFKTLAGITTSDFVGGNMRVQGALRSGEALNVRRSVGTIYGRIYSPNLQEGVQVVGAVQDQSLKFMCRKEDSNILKGDYLNDGGIVYRLESSLQPMYGSKSIHHYEAIIVRLES